MRNERTLCGLLNKPEKRGGNVFRAMTDRQLLEFLVLASLKGILLLIAAWIWLVVVKRASASVRFWVCALAIMGVMVIPIAAYLIPAWSVHILPAATETTLKIQPIAP